MTQSSAHRPLAEQPIRIWDLPLRLFHWLLAATVLGSFISAKVGHMVWHERLGCVALALLAFRLAWGLAGSRYARFSAFVRGPGSVRAYLRGEWRGAGHNPLGALSVLAMLAALSFQAVSGLFTNDDIAFEGPLAHRVSGSLTSLLTTLHRGNEPVLLVLIGLHVAAIVYYRLAERHDLIGPMLHGNATHPAGVEGAQDDRRTRGRALVIATLCALAVAWLVRN